MSDIIRGIQLIGNDRVEGLGPEFSSLDPATGKEIWRGRSATDSQVSSAIETARMAFTDWKKRSFEDRLAIAKAFAQTLGENRDELARIISLEVGKPRWEAQTEISAMIGKVEISAEAFRDRCAETSRSVGGATSWTRFRPHGVVAVFGPFNFPGHIANGHIVPALLAGNTVVFKPSEQAPATAQKTVELWQKAGLPDGAINLLQGGADTGRLLSRHPGIDGVFFTGSHATGLALNRQFSEHPEKILALEMGGNNPLLVFEPHNLKAAALLTVLSAFLTAGQRCTCARRLILPANKESDEFLDELLASIPRIRVGAFTENPEPFMGPLISTTAAKEVLLAQEKLLEKGARALRACEQPENKSAFVTPGVIDVTDLLERDDCEIFGPLLQVIRVRDFDAGIREANATRFGLAAGLISQRRDLRDNFFNEVKAGVLNWNQQLTGASSCAPFGGLGQSGNHRPSGYFAADYCSTAIATMEREELSFPSKLPPGIEPL